MPGEEKFTEEIGSEVEKKAEETPAEQKQVTPAADLSKEEQQVVDEAKEQHEKDGTWPEDTPGWAKKAVNRATRQKYEEKARADKLAKENEELRKKLEEKETSKDPGAKPKIDDFESEEEFYEAMSDWTYKKNEAAKTVKSRETQTQTDQEAQVKEFNQKMDKTFDRGTEKYNDFFKAIDSVPGSIFSHAVVSDIVEVENSEDVAYFLAKNLPEAEKLAGLTPKQRAIEIGKLSVKLSVKPKPKKETKAPEPIDAGKTRQTGPVDESKLTDDEWMAMKRAERIKALTG